MGSATRSTTRRSIKQVLQQGVTNPKALANTLPNANWKASPRRSISPRRAPPRRLAQPRSRRRTSDYVEQQLEADQGDSDPGVELALYFKRVAPTVKNSYGILADKNLLEVVQTIFNLAPTASAGQIDKRGQSDREAGAGRRSAGP